MKITADFSALWRIANELGASPVQLVLGEHEDIKPIDVQLKEGIKVTLDDIEYIGSFPTIEGRQVLLYIDEHNYENKIIDCINGNRGAGNKYHIAYCSTLEDMRKSGRLERYTATTRVDGKFHIRGFDRNRQYHEKEDAELYVCTYCLKMLNYRQARLKNSAMRLRENFDLKEFFETYSSVFPYRPSRSTVDPNGISYTLDWKEISQRLREQKNWHCSDCGVNLQDHHHLLHVHHKDGVKSNNYAHNLAVLCAACHRDQPLHEHMNTSGEQMRVINRLRKQEGLIKSNWDSIEKHADPALRGVLGLAKKKGFSVPEIECELDNHLQVEIAWHKEKMAITLSRNIQPINGWRVMLLEDAHSYFEK